MNQKLDAHGLTRIRGHIESDVEPCLGAVAHVHDGGENVAVAVGDVGILPVERNAIYCARPVPI